MRDKDSFRPEPTPGPPSLTDALPMTTDLADALAAASADTGGRYDAAGLQELLEGEIGRASCRERV